MNHKKQYKHKNYKNIIIEIDILNIFAKMLNIIAINMKLRDIRMDKYITEKYTQ